ncbi:MAG: 3-deoxy-manno-octulosonate cytidylyltransferase [Phycisphaera sp. TMED24]|nr:MAG: 3-deoxy-manno-octulosonate cytidylyltransferase [Phycisphaera sp. TMED24]
MIAGQRVLIVLPVRLGSTRLPKKAILNKTGRPLVVHAADMAAKSKYVDQVVIAGDHDEIRNAVDPYGFQYISTGEQHTSGSSRCAEVMDTIDADIVVNVQGDEPEVQPEHIDAVIEAMTDPKVKCSTLASPLDPVQQHNPNVVKVAMACDGSALYFSRSLVPFDRDNTGAKHWRHVGLYAYRPDTLREFCQMPQTPLEQAEKLEQLRLLENGIPIQVVTHQEPSPPGVDTMEQYESFVERWVRKHPTC